MRTTYTSMTSEVFRPSNGPLMVRGNIADGLGGSADAYRKRDPVNPGSRPQTQGGYRFGQLSHNSFFARHNPHPCRVRHLKGLLDVPICTVNDDGYFSNPRYSMQWPPNNFDSNKIKMYSKYYNVPANSINVNTQKYPINTVTGLQYFLGKPLNMRIFREKAVPRVGLVPVDEAWRDELKALTDTLGLSERKNVPAKPEEPRPRTSQYSATTGRLIPPPSRAMSRQSSRQMHRDRFMGNFSHISEEPDMENMVLQMLCQILQTEDVNAVTSWLVSAGDREKAMVLDMIRASLVSNEQYYKQDPPQEERPRSQGGLPAIGELEGQIIGGEGDDVNSKVDRLTLDGSPQPRDDAFALRRSPFMEPRMPTPPKPSSANITTNIDTSEDDIYKPPAVTTDAFRPRTNRSDRPRSGLSGPRSPPPKSSSPPNLTTEPKLRYTTTPIREQDITSQKASLNEILGPKETSLTWKQEKSVA